MHEFIHKVRGLISSDKTEAALDKLEAHLGGTDPDLANELINLKAALTRSQRERRRGLISIADHGRNLTSIRFSVLDLLMEIEKSIPEKPSLPSVFISYNHDDTNIANQMKSALREHGICVKIDSEAMGPGKDINGFIQKAIRETDITVSIVSNKSLLSAWVSMETILSFYHAAFEPTKQFVACYIDDDFFQPNFHLEATRKIDIKIEEIDTLIPEHIKNKIDTIDLNNEKTRLYHLRNNLGEILLKLKDSFSLDIRKDAFKDSVIKLVRMIKGQVIFFNG